MKKGRQRSSSGCWSCVRMLCSKVYFVISPRVAKRIETRIETKRALASIRFATRPTPEKVEN
jgi:hypothetical protein